ncbi:MAG: 50S ribosomal protein L9 [Ardenticatenales bacterium]|nr:50S ribosomal protein L9 [Ardenticatenales bacterium]
MQVMLIQDVVKLGYVGEVVEVKNGYGRNYLIPQKLAVPATKGALKQAELLRQAAEKRRARDLHGARALAAEINAISLRFERKVGEKGRLYGSVTSGEIAERLETQLGHELDKRKVDLHEPIKMLGNFTVPINIHADVEAAVKVEVVGENGETAADFQEEEAAVEEPVTPVDIQPYAEY